MTWSVVTHDPKTGVSAVVIATCAFAVGARCPQVRAGVGAAATQSMTNPYLAPAVLDAFERGLDPTAAIATALAGDEGRGIRQLHGVDRLGRAAAWTGDNCVDWCGHLVAEGVSVAGNMLAGPAVVSDTLAVFQAGAATPLPDRLLAAMLAGERAGGDKRGRQSAALVMASTEAHADLSIRIDDHADPLAELGRLLALWRATVEPRMVWTPSRARPSGETSLDVIEGAWAAAGRDWRFRR